MSKSALLLLFAAVLAVATLAAGSRDVSDDKSKSHGHPDRGAGGVPGFGSDPGGFFGPVGGFNIPGFGGSGWGNLGGGYGSGYGGPAGGYSRHGVARNSVVCSEPGPCYKKKLTCPAKCFTSYSHSGKNGGGGGGGGGCTMDCTKRCVAYC